MSFDFDLKALGFIIEYSLNEVYIFDLDTLHFKYVNETGRRNLGFTSEELSNLTPLDLKPLFQESQFRKLLAPVKNAERKDLVFETIHKRKDSSTYNVEIHLQAVNYNGVSCGCALILDVTERTAIEATRKLAEQQIQKAQALENTGVLAGEVAHEFNNVLASMIGYADLALQDISPDSEAHSNLSELIEGIKFAAELTNRLLKYSGRGRFNFEALNLNSLIDSMAAILHLALPKNVNLNIDFPDNLPNIFADPTQIRQLLMSLLINAADAIGTKIGQIDIKLESKYCEEPCLSQLFPNNRLAPGDYVILSIIDNGTGLDTAELNSIFDPYHGSNITRLGLGMPVSLGIALSHRGSMKVDSDPEKGTSVEVYIPTYPE